MTPDTHQAQTGGHTPGEWRVEGHTVYTGGTTGKIISHGVNSYGDGPEGYVCTVLKAKPEDISLICAAPELLATLIAVRARFQDYRLTDDTEAVMDRVQAAIAKATQP